MAPIAPSVCGVCDETTRAAFACPHCTYKACDGCSARWFDSRPLSVPSCMNCRAAFRPEHLSGCFSSSAAIRRFENARRAALVAADSAHAIPTMMVLMPKVRKLAKKHNELFRELARAHCAEIELRHMERQLFHIQKGASVAGIPAGTTELSQRVKAGKSNVQRTNRTTIDGLYLDAKRMYTRIASMRLVAATRPDPAQALAPADAPDGVHAPPRDARSQPRYARCTLPECAGAFLVTSDAPNGACAVCSAKHCTVCFVAVGEDEPHVCNADDRATAHYVLTHTKDCPRCRTSIQRSEGCAQMMCTACQCIFDWNTGVETEGVVHNPYYFLLGAEERRRVEADRIARGLDHGAPDRGACERREFDPLCEPFESGLLREALDETGRALGMVRNTLMETYRSVLHTDRIEIPSLRTRIAESGGEKATRIARLRRLAGALAPTLAMVKRMASHPDGYYSQTFYIPHEAPLTDAQYAALLMRNDTARSKLLQILEVHETFSETIKDMLRALLVVTPTERDELVKRIAEFVLRRDELLKKAAEPKKPRSGIKRSADGSPVVDR